MLNEERKGERDREIKRERERCISAESGTITTIDKFDDVNGNSKIETREGHGVIA